jgi:hypothetical protein
MISAAFLAVLVPASVIGSEPHLPAGANCDSSGATPYVKIDGVGNEGQGAGVAFADLNRNGKPDIVLMAYDNPARGNSFRYRIGWDFNFATGTAASWAPGYKTVTGLGWEGQGAGVAFADIDHNGVQDMVVMAYDNPAGANTFRYRVGWNLGVDGTTNNWSASVEIGGVGDEGQGAGVALGDINDNGTLDMVLMATDGSSFRYRVGWDLAANGTSANWSNPVTVPGMGSVAEGADVVLADINLDGTLDMVLMAYDAPGGANNFRYRIGWHLDNTGRAREMSRWYMLKGFGHLGQGAGLAYQHHPSIGQALVFMAYDAPAGANNFRYAVLPVTTSGTTFGVADDKPPVPNNVLSVPANFNEQNAAKLFNLNMSEVQQTANDAYALHIFGCFIVALTGNTATTPVCWADEGHSDVNVVQVFANANYAQAIAPDVLVTAVANYVDSNMSWVNDEVNTYVLNTIHNLNYGPGGEGMPAYYIVHYTDPGLHPNLVQTLTNHNADWGNWYNDGRRFHGDCEDHAILRHALLRALGFDPRYIWNARSPGHEFNVVLYRGSYRIMDYGRIDGYACRPSGITRDINAAWNTNFGPRWSSDVEANLFDEVLKRGYPDRCMAGLGWVLNRRGLPDLNSDNRCCN